MSMSTEPGTMVNFRRTHAKTPIVSAAPPAPPSISTTLGIQPLDSYPHRVSNISRLKDGVDAKWRGDGRQWQGRAVLRRNGEAALEGLAPGAELMAWACQSA